VREDFAERLQRLLGEFPETRPGDLEIEIVETSSLENFNAVNKVIQQCRALGVRFGLDDFGTGYSSLTYLRQLPLDYLKIDMSFVRGMLENPDDLAIVKGVLGLADSLNLPVIAEGVETLQHRNKLMTLGCEFGQGYWLSRPVSGEDLAAWMAHWQEALPEMAPVSGNLVGPV
ncbi:MAG: EAL domain-containing protein, partial [Pseudomonadota bacterium]|nr:EAL domain-containing protein [Pseudomonadota bacterium]